MTASTEWYEANTANFVVYADSPPDKVTKFADELEKFEKVMRFFYPGGARSGGRRVRPIG